MEAGKDKQIDTSMRPPRVVVGRPVDFTAYQKQTQSHGHQDPKVKYKNKKGLASGNKLGPSLFYI
eukprot:8900382-Ditylum_brightwellii.AAC.1